MDESSSDMPGFERHAPGAVVSNDGIGTTILASVPDEPKAKASPGGVMHGD